MPLPTGPAVTFLFSDIEGSTRLERSVGSDAWPRLVARHDDLLRAAIEGAGGHVVKTEGDAFFAAFENPEDALRAAAEGQRALAAEAWPSGISVPVRIGLHIGEGRLRRNPDGTDAPDYVGIEVNYAARIANAGNGRQIVVSDALHAAVGGKAPEDLSFRDEGRRAVKDFDEPAPLYRLVVPGAADDDRPLRTTEVPSNLPADVTALVGRDDEIAELRAALPTTRILTLTGPGGSGKTRLALALAASIRTSYPNGAWFVDLAAVTEASLLEARIARTLGLKDSADRTIEEALHATLRDRTLLLVLDNLEQLLPAAAEVVGALARGAAGVRILVTSRELLRISGERAYAVPPLATDEAIALFEDRAIAHRPDLALNDATRVTIRAICERLGGLPLAVELAAARTRLLSPAQILDRLAHSLDLAGGSRDLPERQRTLRATIDWSHDLLSEAERRLFRRLGAFAGGWSAEAAAAVADPQADLGIDLLDGLESLTDKSLIRVGPSGAGAKGANADGLDGEDEVRFGMHQLLREYAVERLDASGERADVERHHAEFYGALAEEVGPHLLGSRGEAMMRRLDRELHNLTAAVDWAQANDPSLGLRIVGATWRWYHQRGQLREGRRILADLLTRPGTEPIVRLGGLAAEGGLAYWTNDFDAATRAYEERLAIATALGDDLLMADGHYDLGFMSMVSSNPQVLQEHEQRAVELYVKAGREEGAVRARQALVLSVFLAGEYGRARELERENLAAFERFGSAYQVADSLTLQSAISYRVGEPDVSWDRMLDGLRIFIPNDSASGLARGLGMAAILQLTYGDPELGARITGTTYEIIRQHGVMLAPVKVLHLPDPAELATERLGETRSAELMAEGAAVPMLEMAHQILEMPIPDFGREAVATAEAG